MNIREMLGEEHLAQYFRTHVVPQKFRSSKPDGVYDLQERDCKWRDVIVDGCIIMTISKMWLDSGGPEDVHDEFKRPWGYFCEKNS